MKTTKYLSLFLIIILAISAIYWGFTSTDTKKVSRELTDDFRKYWFSGEAEITSYELSQARYGEVRDGKSVLIFVSEPFLKNKQVKADNPSDDDVTVLKLNSTKNYITGIYPYSIMTSTFFPISYQDHAIKVTNTVTEWCGQAYTQINSRDRFEVTSHSYFENEADQNYKIEEGLLEDEIWTQIRINPQDLPIGNIDLIPSLEYTRLKHIPVKKFKAEASLDKKGALSSYKIHYPNLERTLVINFKTKFPHTIDNWQETYKSGFGKDAKKLTSTAKKIRTIKSAYWSKKSITDVSLRDSLGL
ncbi:septum formation inhibitor Maf [Joostella atrarenae]|uniref:Septum formation inhibitor Maf n=1 Tax=Joostella atrarenae TaxID=679257 RepID=A0ABS9J5M8_9FLAO|nr:septum formation inhibitor Maf [Joostella atrarenae]MCF8715742.1 septum formation inhibitor Maf [Joostella atrarenae]